MKKLTIVLLLICTIVCSTLFCIPTLRNYGFIQISSLFCAILASFLGIQAVFIEREDTTKRIHQGEAMLSPASSAFRALLRALKAMTWMVFPLCLLVFLYPLFISLYHSSLELSSFFQGFPRNDFSLLQQGFEFSFLGPWFSAAFGSILGVLVGFLFRKRWRACFCSLLFIIFSLLISAWQTAMAFFSTVYNPFFGFLPLFAATQERILSYQLLSLPLIRLSQLLWFLALFLLFTAGIKNEQLLFRPWYLINQKKLGFLGCISMLILQFGLSHLLRPTPDLSGKQLLESLPGQFHTEHFVLRYDPKGPWAKDMEWIGFEHEFRYEQLKQKLGIEPNWKIPLWQKWLGLEPIIFPHSSTLVSYLFSSEAQMRQFLGISGETMPSIASPWKRTLYLNPHLEENFLESHTLTHELSHIFLGAKGDSVFHLSFSGILPNMGMIEGFAHALDNRAPIDAKSVHIEANLNKKEPLEKINLFDLFTPKFYFSKQKHESIYSLPGSFCRYLLYQEGAAKLLQVYKQGGLPQHFEKVYEKPFHQLKTEWITWISKQTPKPFFFPFPYELGSSQEEYEDNINLLLDKAIENVATVNLTKQLTTKGRKNKKEISPDWQKLNKIFSAAQASHSQPEKLIILEQIQEKKPLFGWLYFLRGLLYFHQKLYEQAAFQLKQALQAQYSLPPLYEHWAQFFYGQSLFYQKQFDQAQTQFEKLTISSVGSKEHQMIVDFLERSQQAPLLFEKL